MTFQLLVTAKAPVVGRVKTRLGAEIGMEAAAALAAAALLDTMTACAATAGAARCHLSLDGSLDDAVAGEQIRAALVDWTVRPQRGADFAQRLVHAHGEVPGPVVQVGMDTPQLTPELLRQAARGLDRVDAVLGLAEDGGWWVLALRDPAAAVALAGVPMSTSTTGDDTRAALETAGLRVGGTTVLRDVDTVPDAEAVAAAAPGSRFAQEWRALTDG